MRKIIIVTILVFILLINIIMLINFNMILKSKKYINKGKTDIIVVLGAGIQDDKTGILLNKRLEKAVELFKENEHAKIIISGTDKNGRDETKIMSEYLISNGIPINNIIIDSKSLTTYDTIYRLDKIYEVKSCTIITQRYHLYRSIYLARKFNIKAYGTYPKDDKYTRDISRNIKEIFVRVKEYIYTIFKPDATYLGEITPIERNEKNENTQR